MITFAKCYVTADGTAYATLEEAQISEIADLLQDSHYPDTKSIAERIVKEATTVVNILTTTSKSRPRARKINGGKKTRKIVPVGPTGATTGTQAV